jgi:Domain of unknown function (DUF4189)
MQRKVSYLLGGLSIVSLTLAIGVLSGSGRAIAQSCGDGMQSFQGAADTSPRCVPIPGYMPPDDGNNNNNNDIPAKPRREPRLVAVPSYGAIAHDPTTFSIGVSGADKTFDSKKKADKAALKMCRDNGGGDSCAIVTSIKDACTTLSIGLDTKTGPVLLAIEFKPFDDAAKNKAAKVCTDKYEACETKYFCAYNNITKTVR